MTQYCLKRRNITAWQYRGNPKERPDWVYCVSNHYFPDNSLRVRTTFDGTVNVSSSDFISKGTDGSIDVWSESAFLSKYEYIKE